jgi:hypothetical protein
LATALAVALAAWVQVVEKPYERQQSALAALEKFAQRIELRDPGPRWLPEWVAKRLRRAVAVHVERLEIRDEHLKPIGQLPYLERLYLARTPVTDAGLAHLAGLANLRRISLWGTEVTDAGLRHLAGKPRLEALDVHETKCTQACLAPLTPAARMKTLVFSFEVDDRGIDQLVRLANHCPGHLTCRDATLAGLRKLRRLRGITDLSLSGTDIGAEEAQSLLDIGGLTRVFAQQGSLDGAGLRVLRSSPSLQYLQLVETKAPIAEVIEQYAPKLRRLQAIHDDFRVTTVGPYADVVILKSGSPCDLSTLSQARGLEALTVGSEVQSGDKVDLSLFTNLKELIWLAPLQDRQLEQLSRLTGLRQLTLGGAGRDLTIAAIEPLGRLSQLRVLRLQDYRLTDGHLAFLTGLTELRELDLSGNTLQGRCLPAFQKLPHLACLTLNRCENLDPANLRHVVGCQTLRRLDLQRTSVSDAGLEVLYGMPNLKSVSIGGSLVTPRGRAALRAKLPPDAEVY